MSASARLRRSGREGRGSTISVFAEEHASFLTEKELWGGLEPYAFQREFFEDNHFATALIGEVGPGKTTACCAKSMWLSLAHPRNRGIWGRLDKDELYDSVFDVWDTMYPYDEFGPKGRQIFEYEGGETKPHTIRFFNNSKITLAPMKDRSKFQGTNYGWAFIDQLEQISFEYFSLILKRIRRSGIPIGHQLIFATVNKESNYWWIKRLFEEKRGFGQTLAARLDSGAEDFHAIYNPLHVNKALADVGYYERTERAMRLGGSSESEIRRLLYGEDDEMYGRVLPDLNMETHHEVVDFRALAASRNGEFWIAYDEGANVPSAFLLAYREKGGRFYIGAERYVGGNCPVDAHAAALRVLAEEVGFPLAKETCNYVADWNIKASRAGTGLSILDIWDEEWPWGRPPTKDLQYTFKLIQKMSRTKMPDGRQQLIIDREKCPCLWSEVQDLTFDPQKSGQWDFLRKGGPVRKHAIDALRYLVVTAGEPWKAKRQYDPQEDWKKGAGTRSAYEWAKKKKGRGMIWPTPGGVGPSHPLESPRVPWAA